MTAANIVFLLIVFLVVCGLAALAHDAGYFDQPHMVRDFRELAGLAPAQLLARAAGSDPAYWVYRIAPDDFDKLFFQFD